MINKYPPVTRAHLYRSIKRASCDARSPQSVKKPVKIEFPERKFVRKKPIRGVFRLFNHKFCNFFESCKTCSACRKGFFDKLRASCDARSPLVYQTVSAAAVVIAAVIAPVAAAAAIVAAAAAEQNDDDDQDPQAAVAAKAVVIAHSLTPYED